MDEVELCRIRAEEFERNFESIRAIEWRNALEVFTGYAVIGIAYWQLHEKYPGSKLLGLGAGLLTLILYSCNLYISRRVQERLHFTRDMQNLYLARIHELLNVRRIEQDPPPHVRRPIHGKWWAHVPQTILSTAAMLALLTYVLGTTCGCGPGV